MTLQILEIDLVCQAILVLMICLRLRVIILKPDRFVLSVG